MPSHCDFLIHGAEGSLVDNLAAESWVTMAGFRKPPLKRQFSVDDTCVWEASLRRHDCVTHCVSISMPYNYTNLFKINYLMYIREIHIIG